MSRFIQSLESRMLMTASSGTLAGDATAVTVDSAAVRTAVATRHTEEVTLRTAVLADVKLSQTKAEKPSNAKLEAAFQRALATGDAKVSAAAAVLIANAKARAQAGAAAGKALLLHPTKTPAQNLVTKDIALLTSVIPAKLTLLQTVIATADSNVDAALANLVAANISLASTVQVGEGSVSTDSTALSTAGAQVVTDTTKLATDLGNPVTPTVTLTDATFFRGNSTGDNQGNDGVTVDHGGWGSELDVQNVPGNYGAEFFISKVANPTAADFLTPGTLAAALSVGLNTFYFWADSDDTAGGTATFGLNLFFNGAGPTSPSVSGYTIPGTGQTLAADSAPLTMGTNFKLTPGAGTLTVANGSSASSTVTLSTFQVLGVSGQGSTVDIVDSTNTAPFVAPAHADGITDTYGIFTITVTP